MPSLEVATALQKMLFLEETDEGCRVATHCLFPSFEAVHVYVVKIGEGYRVHDGGEGFRIAWLHGRDAAAIGRALDVECRRFKLEKSDDNSIFARADNVDWLHAAILSVANASSAAANSAVSKFTAATERALSERIAEALSISFGAHSFVREYEASGKSGGKRRFDFMLRAPGTEVLINAVAPHHSSIAAKYVSFADIDVRLEQKLAVFDRRLDTDDAALIHQVALAMPLVSLPDAARRALHG